MNIVKTSAAAILIMGGVFVTSANAAPISGKAISETGATSVQEVRDHREMRHHRMMRHRMMHRRMMHHNRGHHYGRMRHHNG